MHASIENHAGLPLATHATHFLLIEDSLTIRGFLRRTLEKAFDHCVVHEAIDGKAGLHEMSQNSVHAVISDLDMPGMDGRTFLRLINQSPVLRRKPILVLSSAITPELTKEYASNPRVRFLPKPALPDDICGALRALLAAH